MRRISLQKQKSIIRESIRQVLLERYEDGYEDDETIFVFFKNGEVVGHYYIGLDMEYYGKSNGITLPIEVRKEKKYSLWSTRRDKDAEDKIIEYVLGSPHTEFDAVYRVRATFDVAVDRDMDSGLCDYVYKQYQSISNEIKTILAPPTPEPQPEPEPDPYNDEDEDDDDDYEYFDEGDDVYDKIDEYLEDLDFHKYLC